MKRFKNNARTEDEQFSKYFDALFTAYACSAKPIFFMLVLYGITILYYCTVAYCSIVLHVYISLYHIHVTIHRGRLDVLKLIFVYFKI